MVLRKVRDDYGNWVWEDDGVPVNQIKTSRAGPKNYGRREEAELKLDWRDWIALTIASFQTVLLPITVIIVLLVVFALILGH